MNLIIIWMNDHYICTTIIIIALFAFIYITIEYLSNLVLKVINNILITRQNIVVLKNNHDKMKQGLKDHHIRDLTNFIRNHLQSQVPALSKLGCLRTLISNPVNTYLYDNNLCLDKHNKDYNTNKMKDKVIKSICKK